MSQRHGSMENSITALEHSEVDSDQLTVVRSTSSTCVLMRLTHSMDAGSALADKVILKDTSGFSGIISTRAPRTPIMLRSWIRRIYIQVELE